MTPARRHRQQQLGLEHVRVGGDVGLRLWPITLRDAAQFVTLHHRHNDPAQGWKFGVGVRNGAGELVGVATCGRPVAREFDDGLTLEINRTCTDGARNANSMLYGACWRAARALGYTSAITYTQADEDGASLRAAGFVRECELPARGSWAAHSVTRSEGWNDPEGSGGVARVRWRITRGATTGHRAPAPARAGTTTTAGGAV